MNPRTALRPLTACVLAILAVACPRSDPPTPPLPEATPDQPPPGPLDCPTTPDCLAAGADLATRDLPRALKVLTRALAFAHSPEDQAAAKIALTSAELRAGHCAAAREHLTSLAELAPRHPALRSTFVRWVEACRARAPIETVIASAERADEGNFARGRARQLAFSPDGRFLSMTGSGTSLWDTRTWRRAFTVEDSECMIFLSSGRALAGCGTDTLRVFDLESGAIELVSEQQPFRVHGRNFPAANFGQVGGPPDDAPVNATICDLVKSGATTVATSERLDRDEPSRADPSSRLEVTIDELGRITGPPRWTPFDATELPIGVGCLDRPETPAARIAVSATLTARLEGEEVVVSDRRTGVMVKRLQGARPLARPLGVVGSLLLLEGGAYAAALDLATGKQVWAYSGPIEAGRAMKFVLSDAGSWLLAESDSGALVALSSQTGIAACNVDRQQPSGAGGLTEVFELQGGLLLRFKSAVGWLSPDGCQFEESPLRPGMGETRLLDRPGGAVLVHAGFMSATISGWPARPGPPLFHLGTRAVPSPSGTDDEALTVLKDGAVASVDRKRRQTDQGTRTPLGFSRGGTRLAVQVDWTASRAEDSSNELHCELWDVEAEVPTLLRELLACDARGTWGVVVEAGESQVIDLSTYEVRARIPGTLSSLCEGGAALRVRRAEGRSWVEPLTGKDAAPALARRCEKHLSDETAHALGDPIPRRTPAGGLRAEREKSGAVALRPTNGTDVLASVYFFGPGSYALIGADHRYLATPNVRTEIAFRRAGELYPFDQLDLYLNRPDLVLAPLGFASEATLEGYRRAIGERAARMGLRLADLQREIEGPEVWVRGIPSASATRKLSFAVWAADLRRPLKSFQALVNGVPIKTGGAPITQRLGAKAAAPDWSASTTVEFELSQGQNLLEVWAVNSAGGESQHLTYEIAYTGPAVPENLFVAAIGVSAYADPSRSLDFAAKDAADVVEALLPPEGGRLGRGGVLLLQDAAATRRRVVEETRRLFKRAGVDDTVVLFIAGHGLLDHEQRYLFAPHEMNFDALEGGMTFSELEELFAQTRARHRLLLIDTCHAGELAPGAANGPPASTEYAEARARGFKTVNLTAQAPKAAAPQPADLFAELETIRLVDLRRGVGAMALVSSAGLESALESTEWKNGAFTAAIMATIAEATATGSDAGLTVSRLHEQVVRRVAELTQGRQRPNIRLENLSQDFRVR